MGNAIFLDGEVMAGVSGKVEREMVKVASPADGARVFPGLTSATGAGRLLFTVPIHESIF
ncbi:uncharacterized protein N7484_002484 [Penicillium longicatenatum]|uniref:uncharacterized protein n=1 Tax=Penicillium longicatenatum TaxID=1561947 RepID=UPI002547C26D|nr:uncharacterized protein N7484_002484 [Penicillium longicatenatum]KAJ5658835.1 hypothetical protein N7484_002484 [Penicillium longicatenatum]